MRSESAVKLDEIAGSVDQLRGKALWNSKTIAPPAARSTPRSRKSEHGPAAALPEDAPILQCHPRRGRALGIRSHLDCASTDANIPLSMGLPPFPSAPAAREAAPTPRSEWFHPEGREFGLKRILLTLLLLLARSGSRGRRN